MCVVDRSKFLQWLSMKGLSEATKKKYLYYFSKFPAEEFNQGHVNYYLSQPTNQNPNCRAFITNLRDFLIETFPDVLDYQKIRIPKRTGRKVRKLPDFPTEEELPLIEHAMLEERNKLMLLISFYGGLRPAGLLKIRAIDFDWKEWKNDPLRPCKLKVTEKGQKERLVFIPGHIMRRLASWIQSSRMNHSPGLKIWMIGYRRWHFFLTEACKKSIGRSLSPHKLRHGCATWLLNNGWTLQELSDYLGHESIATTQIYAHLDKKKIQQKYSDLFT